LSRWFWIGGALTLLLALAVGMQTARHWREKGAIAGETVSMRPAGADLYIELDSQTARTPWTYTQSRIEVQAGQTVAIGLRNSDRLPHDLVFGAPYHVRTKVLQEGQVQWILFRATKPTRGMPFWCSVPGHRQNGMEGVLIVRGD
jgi:uncharacterized cupredoxin-like copper-binding protein